MEEHGGEPSDGLPTESRRYGRLENLRYDSGKAETAAIPQLAVARVFVRIYDFSMVAA